MTKDYVKLQHSDILNAKIEASLVDNIYRQATMGFVISLICATMVLVFIIYSEASDKLIYYWYIAFVIIGLARMIVANLYFKTPADEIRPKKWRFAYVIGTLLSGIAWGIVGTPLILPIDQPLVQSMILVILAGVTAGSVPLNAYIREATIVFILCALLPLIIYLMTIKDLLYILFNITVIVFMTSLIILTFKLYHILHQSLLLHFENDELLVELSDAKKQLEITNKRLQQAATHDPLTHIANRHLFEIILQDAINQAEHKKQNLALFYLDLDKFKDVNDTYGHHAGDQLLLVVIARIKNILRDNDTIARIGGDEITIILENATHFETVTDIAERICQAIAKPIKIDNAEIQVFASIGISMYPTDGKDMKKLIEVADKAMYFVKENGGNSFHFNVDSK